MAVGTDLFAGAILAHWWHTWLCKSTPVTLVRRLVGDCGDRSRICTNLFNVADRDEYLAYSRRSAKEVQAHGGRVIALGKFREAASGDIKPRAVMILVE